MDFVDKKLPITLSDGDEFNFVWEQKLGDLVIIVLDDYWDYVLGSPEAQNPLMGALPQLRLRACELPKTRGIGFFVLPGNQEDADKVLLSIQNWIKDITIPKHNMQVRFLVDALYGSEGDETVELSNYIIGELADLGLREHIAYLTQAGEGASGLLPGYPVFSKADETNYAREHKMFSPELMSFLGLHCHENEIINDAIEVTEKQLHTPHTLFHESLDNLDELINYLSDFDFDGYQYEDLAGKLPQIEIAYVKFMARYLKASLNLEDEIQHQVAMQCVTGDDRLQAMQARSQVQKILGRSRTSYLISQDPRVIEELREFVESDDLLQQAKGKIFGEDTD